MSAGHAHALYRPGDSPVHRLPAECKLVAVVSFVLVVVTTPREQFWAFAAYAALLAGVAVVARVPPGFLARRMLIEVPFVAFAVALPFVSAGPQTQVLGLTVSASGLMGAFNILVKGTLGVASSVLLAATTEVHEVLRGLENLRLPWVFVTIASFFIRYVTVVTDDMARMRVARESRCFEARSARQLKVMASVAGSLFIRTYERGERVYLAMVSRGYTGGMPRLAESRPGRLHWAAAAALPAAALAVSVTAWMRMGA